MFDDFFNKIPEKSCKKENEKVYYKSTKKTKQKKITENIKGEKKWKK